MKIKYNLPEALNPKMKKDNYFNKTNYLNKNSGLTKKNKELIEALNTKAIEKNKFLDELNSFDKYDFTIKKEHNIDSIAKRIATGQNVSDEEMAYISENNPILVITAKISNEKRLALKAEVNRRITRKEKNEAIHTARVDTLTLSKNHNQTSMDLVSIDSVSADVNHY